MNLHPSEIALLKDLALAKSSWVSATAEAIKAPREAFWVENNAAWSKLSEYLQCSEAKEAFVAVVSELISGVLHSTLVSLDGGSALAETTSLSIKDADGHVFKRCLHEFWPEYSHENHA